VAPEKVALPITVEVADALDMPVVGDWRVRHAAFVLIPKPSISQK